MITEVPNKVRESFGRYLDKSTENFVKSVLAEIKTDHQWIAEWVCFFAIQYSIKNTLTLAVRSSSSLIMAAAHSGAPKEELDKMTEQLAKLEASVNGMLQDSPFANIFNLAPDWIRMANELKEVLPARIRKAARAQATRHLKKGK